MPLPQIWMLYVYDLRNNMQHFITLKINIILIFSLFISVDDVALGQTCRGQRTTFGSQVFFPPLQRFRGMIATCQGPFPTEPTPWPKRWM